MRFANPELIGDIISSLREQTDFISSYQKISINVTESDSQREPVADLRISDSLVGSFTIDEYYHLTGFEPRDNLMYSVVKPYLEFFQKHYT